MNITGSRLLQVGNGDTVAVTGNQLVVVSEGQNLTVNKTIVMQSVEDEIIIEAATKITLKVGGSSITITPEDITVVAPQIFLN